MAHNGDQRRTSNKPSSPQILYSMNRVEPLTMKHHCKQTNKVSAAQTQAVAGLKAES